MPKCLFKFILTVNPAKCFTYKNIYKIHGITKEKEPIEKKKKKKTVFGLSFILHHFFQIAFS